MPGLDGTGPRGKGPLTGRSLGKCFQDISTPGKIKLISLAIPAVVAIVDDFRKPEGITRKIYTVVIRGIIGKTRKQLPENSGDDVKKIETIQ